MSVTALSTTPVKGTRLHRVGEVELGLGGARGDRRFFVIDDRSRMVNAKQVGALQSVVADFDEADRRLTLTFPDGSRVADVVRPGARTAARFFSEERPAWLVDGPWSQALSRHAGQPLRLVEGGTGVDRGAEGGVTLISEASLERLAEEAQVASLDSRRFRMLIEVGAVPAHAEDDWVGRTVRIGRALVRFGGNVGRCLITSRHPETGEVDLPTLDVLRAYRGEVASTEALPFGVYGRVLEEGWVRVGDPVSLVS